MNMNNSICFVCLLRLSNRILWSNLYFSMFWRWWFV